MDKDSIKSRVRREIMMMLILVISGWIILIMFFLQSRQAFSKT